jgi:hypothetical protein
MYIMGKNIRSQRNNVLEDFKMENGVVCGDYRGLSIVL